jgi:hypothetical protein
MSERIAAVLRIRRLQERRERAEVAGRRREHRGAQEAETTAWRAVSSRPFPTAISGASIAGHRAVLEGGIGVARRRNEATGLAAHAVEVQVATWSVAARRVEGLERLDERLRAAEQADLERREAIEVEDLVLARRPHPQSAAGSHS